MLILPMTRRCPDRFRLVLMGLAVFLTGLGATDLSAQDRVSSQQVRKIKQINSGIERAARLYQNRNLDKSSEVISDLASELTTLIGDKPSASLLAAVQQTHASLKQAREVLVQGGQSIPAIADLPEPEMDPDAPVSFTREIATLLNSNCGSCHVQRTRGQFSMASFNRLAEGVGGAPVVVPGKPEESRIIEVIEEGSMPPDGELPEASLARLKKWIADGAPFDGEDRTATLDTFAPAPRRTAPEIEIMRPAGNETISFSRDVAPVLITNCVGCHFEARNVRGGLRIDNFRQFLRGGDSGALVKPGDGKGSLIVQRLTATDNTRMPQRRQPLERDVIDKIITWIDEGARFDGRTGQMNLRDVSAIAISEAATHEELADQRQADALRTWKKVMNDIKEDQLVAENVFVTGSTENGNLNDFNSVADSISGKIKSELKMDDDDPVVKGQVAIFVFDRRYDYSEFGKMIEQRDLPKSWRSHWGFDTVNAYVAINSRDATVKELKPELTQRIAAVAVASLGADVPEWFADGLGYVVSERLIDDKAIVNEWRKQSEQAIANMQNPADFLQQRLANDKSGLVAYAFVKSLRDQSPRDFQNFLKSVRSGEPFEEAFAASWSTTPVELIRQRFGGQNNRQRRNRANGR